MSGKQQGRLIDLFVAGATVRAAAEIVGVNRNTARTFYHRLRQLIASKLPSYDLSGEVEADKSYFGDVRKGKRGRAATGKVPVFGLLKRRGKVFTAIIPNAGSRTLLPIIREQVPPDSIVYTDSFTAYDVGCLRVPPSARQSQQDLRNQGGHPINGIENFWNQARRHLRRFNGITPDNFTGS